MHHCLRQEDLTQIHNRQRLAVCTVWGLSVLLEELPLPPEDKTAIQCPENMSDLHFTGNALLWSQSPTTCTQE